MIRRLLFILFLFLFIFPAQCHVMIRDSTAYNTALMQVDELLMQVETISSTLDSINKITKNGFNTREIEEDIPEIINNLKIINDNLVLYSKVLNVKNLQMFQVLLEDIKNQLDKWRSALFRYNRELSKMKLVMNDFFTDSSMRAMSTDTIFQHLYLNEVKDMKSKWADARHFTTSNLLRITRLQAKVSKTYFQTIELQEMVMDRLREYRRRNWGKEFEPLYYIHSNTQHAVSGDLVKKSYEGQRKILGYYIQRNWYNQLFIFMIAIGFFIWVFLNFKKIRQTGKAEVLTDARLKYINGVPVLATLTVLFNIAPFFDLNPPSAYVELAQLFLLIVLTILFAKTYPRHLFYNWLIIILLYLLLAVTYGIITPGLATRSCLLLLNIFSLLFGSRFIWNLKKEMALPSFVKIVFIIYFATNFVSAFCNIFGRVTMAKVLSMAGIFGLTQIIGLSVFIHIVSEAVLLQTICSRIIGGVISRMNAEKILRTVDRFLSVFILIFWIIIFATNVGMYAPLYDFVATLLTATRKFGSISFTLGNFLLFFVILYISNTLQKYIGYFFGDEDGDSIPDKKGTRMVILRLILLIVGFFLAVTASGLPIDRITIVLGALGVGIGLGLQNIFNNLISGIILIFENPFEIGDSIEVGNKKGRVKDMGIRSSRLITTDGSEVIVPNGDLLSGQVINWSVNNNMLRSEVVIKIEPDAYAQAKEYIVKAVSANPGIVKKIPVDVSLMSIADSGAELRIQFWINNIRKERELKSVILMDLYKSLKEHNIKIL